jgi:HEXXH motif-containing protein
MLPPLRDLTLPEPGSHTARDVLSLALRRLLRDLRGLTSLPVRDPVFRDLEQLVRALNEVQKRSPGALASALRRVDVATPLRCARNPQACPIALDDLAALIVSTFAAELARLSALPGELVQRWLPRRITCSGGRFTIDVPPWARTIAYENGAITLRGELGEERIALPSSPTEGTPTAPHVRATYHEITKAGAGLLLALEDDNPLAMVEAHPDKQGNPIDLGGRPASAWIASIRDALDRVERHLPALRAEMELYLQQIVPVGFDAEKHLSASYREAIGTVYLTLHPSAMTMTEALIHEFQHNKLNALFEHDDVLENAFSPLYKSPVRPDPRPLHGVLLAIHAFFPVARLYERMIEADDPEARSDAFRARYRAIARINREGADVVLANAEPTPVGKPLFDELARWDHHYRPIADQPA